MEHDVQTTKVLVAALFFLVRFFFGVLPVKLYNCLRRWEEEDESGTFINHRRHTQVNCAIALCQSFGGGVLFATCFLHMMLEVYNSMEDLKRIGNLTTDYPLSQLTISLGFFFVYFLEEISHWLIARIPDKPWTPKQKISGFTRSSVTPLGSGANEKEKENEKEAKRRRFCRLDEEVEEKRSAKVFIVEGVDEDDDQDEDRRRKKKEHEATLNDKRDKLSQSFSIDDRHENIVYDSLSLNSEVLKENAKNLDLTEEALHEQEEALECEVKTQQQIMRCVLIVLALSFHAVFEGLAIGLQNNPADIWYLFTAVSIHSATILFCIGLELLLAKAKTKYIVIQMLALALASPFGVILGLLVTIKNNLETRAKSTAVVLLEGLSAGTILYITFFEVLNREKERRVYRIYRALCIMAGFSLMAFLQYLEVYH